MTPALTRRTFLLSSAAATATAALSRRGPRWKGEKLQILHVGVAGMQGGSDYEQLKSHPAVAFTGLCDVDAGFLAERAKAEPQAFTCRDFREAFDKHVAQFDAVVVTTPDHVHALVVLAALKAGKHVYCQKPLAHELGEVRAIAAAARAKPELKTQLGNQRCVYAGRQQALWALKSGQIGKPREAFVWTGAPAAWAFYMGRERPPEAPVPASLDWNLWLGPAAERPFAKDAYAPIFWRNIWDFGTGGIGDMGCHAADVLFYAYPLGSALAVQSDTHLAAAEVHAWPTRATITFAGGAWSAGERFVVRVNDSGVQPSRAALGLPADAPFADTGTIVVGETGTLVLGLDGAVAIYRGGKEDKGVKYPEVPPRDHYHDWVDACLGKGPGCMTPFEVATRLTETVLLGPKAARFPGRELLWDGTRFTNLDAAENALLTTRAYRKGFELPA
jgi:predicted dehydrogenase